MQVFFGKNNGKWICLDCGEVSDFEVIFKRKVPVAAFGGMGYDREYLCPYCKSDNIIKLSVENKDKIQELIKDK